MLNRSGSPAAGGGSLIGNFLVEKSWSLAICLTVEVSRRRPFIGGAFDLKRFANIWEESGSRHLLPLLQ
jgi:hypothetical protein